MRRHISDFFFKNRLNNNGRSKNFSVIIAWTCDIQWTSNQRVTVCYVEGISWLTCSSHPLVLPWRSVHAGTLPASTPWNPTPTTWSWCVAVTGDAEAPVSIPSTTILRDKLHYQRRARHERRICLVWMSGRVHCHIIHRDPKQQPKLILKSWRKKRQIIKDRLREMYKKKKREERERAR